MSMRITDKNLQAVVDRINRQLGTPAASYVKDADGKYKAQIGNYHLSHAYGGVALHRMVNEAGGVSDVLRCGHVPKRELYHMLFAFIAGWEAAQAS